MKFLKEIIDINKRYNIIKKGDKIIVGFSGGADSVFLTEILLKMQKEINFFIILTHVNHMLRGADADSDENFAVEYGKHYNIPVFIKKTDVQAIANINKMSFEEAGREVRYEFYNEILNSENCNKIALAHNKDDQIENFLFRLMRGTSLKGLEGIYSRDIYIRPISHIYKKDILEYLDTNNIKYCIDKTNFNVDYTRNSIRLGLIPFIEKKYNLNFKDKIYSLIEEIREVNKIVDIDLNDYIDEDKLVIDKLQKETIYTKNIIINKYLCNSKMKFDKKNITRNKIENIVKLLSKGGTKEISLDKNYILKKIYNLVSIEKRTDDVIYNNKDKSDCLQIKNIKTKNIEKKGKGAYEVEFVVPGKIKFGKYIISGEIYDNINIEIEKNKEKIKEENIFYTSLECNKKLKIRYRKDGDKIIPMGMGNYKKIKEIFIDEKIPKDLRDDIPIITLGIDNFEEILWVVGVKKSERFKNISENINKIKLVVKEDIVGK
ncbi:MAG: tRNA lysidine(34) synthetase TilS [Fusobacteriaceae bacterium]|jgi:tRNA(Ile)-lysidine synthase|nr:tRNA lysidine(34) synthetase TilS [Fusobacteriaceae bacterium]